MSRRRHDFVPTLEGTARLDHDEMIDSYPSKHEAENARSAYARLLRRHSMTDRYGVYVKPLTGNKGIYAYGLYVGPHVHSTQMTKGR